MRDDSSDVLRCINVEQYDEILAFVRRELPELERRRPAQNVVLRDSNADQTGGWIANVPAPAATRSVVVQPAALARAHASREGIAESVLDQHARPIVPFEQGRDSRVEALHRMLQVLSIHFSYKRSAVHRALPLMRFRAHVMAFLRLRAHSVWHTLPQLRTVVRAPSPLVRVVREGASDELGQALWPYVR